MISGREVVDKKDEKILKSIKSHEDEKLLKSKESVFTNPERNDNIKKPNGILSKRGATLPTTSPLSQSNGRVRAELGAGAGYDGCLNADDIDSLLERLDVAWRCGDRERVSAWWFFLARTQGGNHMKNLQRHIDECLRRGVAIVLPVHVRHHWMTAVVSRADDGVSVTTLDSAPSAAARRDISRWMEVLLQGHRVTVRPAPFPRQLRCSEECGLFTTLAVAVFMLAGQVPWDEVAEGVVSLAHWRQAIMSGQQELPTWVTHILSSASSAGGNHVTDVDNDDEVDTWQFTLRELHAADIATDHFWASWGQMAAKRAREQHASDLRQVKAEWEALSRQERKRRTAEFDRRRRHHRFDVHSVALRLKDAPLDVRKTAMWPIVRQYVQNIVRHAEETNAQAEFDDLLEGTRAGQLVNARVLKALIDVVRQEGDHLTVLDSVEFDFQRRRPEFADNFHPDLGDIVVAILYKTRTTHWLVGERAKRKWYGKTVLIRTQHTARRWM